MPGTMRTSPEAPAPHRARPLLHGRDVHVWSIDLEGEPGDAACLDEREHERARRFVFVEHARRYLRAHVALRHILAAYVDGRPGELHLAESQYGKPQLLPPHAGLHFSLSHSKALALVAVGVCNELGVDIEATTTAPPEPGLAAAVLCTDELERLSCLPEAEQAQSFIACWARKEACLKAIGLGLQLPPSTLHVGLGEQRVRLRVAGRDLELVPLRVPTGYRAALAVQSGFGAVHRFEYEAPD